MTMAITLLGALVLEHEGNWEEIFTHVKSKARPNQECFEQAEHKLKKLEEQGYRNLCLVDAEYPQILKKLNKPPFLISIRDKEVIEKGHISVQKDLLIHLGYIEDANYASEIFKLISYEKLSNSSFKNQIQTCRYIGLNVCDLLVANEVEAEPTFYNISEEQFEKICKLVQRAYLKADNIDVLPIVKALATMLKTKKLKEIKVLDLIQEACFY